MELALSHGGMMKRILSIVRSFALIASVLLASPTYADFLSCTDFDKIIRFVEAEHLRFSAEKNSNLKTLLESAAQKIPEILRYEGAYVMAAQFENYWPAQLQNEKIWFSTQNLCEALFHSRHREALLKAFVSALDPFSEFYSSNELDKKTSVVDGHFVGVGVGTKSEDRYLRVTEVVEGGPSHSILREGDLISHIDDHPVRGLSLFDLRQRIRGPLHSLVEFRVKRDKQILNLKVRRDHVYQKSLTHEWVEENILQIKIHRFYAHTPAQLGNLVRENYSRIKGLILDLRDNPGGLLQAARDIVDLFVSQGVVVHLKGTYEDQMWALGDADFLDTP